MGCTSSTEVVTDAHTGQVKHKHKMGGSYPGNRRQPQEQYTPNISNFNKQGQATAHFVSYGGGNALVLQSPSNGGGTAGPELGATAIPIQQQQQQQQQPQYIQVTLPDGVHAGQTIHVQATNGALNEIVVPEGFGPGSTFTVEFAERPNDDYTKTTSYQTPPSSSSQPSVAPYQSSSSSYASPTTPFASSSNYPTAAASPISNGNNFPPSSSTTNPDDYDDGFASGFRNPNFVPGPVTAAPAFASVYGTNHPNNNNVYPMAASTVEAKPIYPSTY